MTKYRVAFIGTGAILPSHLEAIAENSDRVELVAAVDVDKAKVKAVCAAHNIPHWFTDSAEMLARIQPDLVHILTPPFTHFQIILDSLEAGAHVYCEKPLCASLDQFDRITAKEAETGRYCSTVFQWRFGSAGKHLKKLIDNGDLGRPLVAHANTLWYRDEDYYAVPWRGNWATETGGPTMILGIHLTDLMLWLLGGQWQELFAMVDTLERNIDVEDIAMALVRFEDGALAHVVNSALSPRQESYLRLDFQRATVECSTLYRYTNKHWTYSIADQMTHTDELERWRQIEGGDVMGSHAAQLSEILDSIDAGVRPFVSGEEGRRILEFSTSLYKSGFTNQPIQRGSITADDPFYYAMNGKYD
ncbi:MAG: Gfo/Idh/MocA family oxidoreductase [Anaerolineae bacterium]|nr:Gfo/Idh/MocA family oxidoreductase [Anaerolineae bacterium]MCO5188322.1 Gfo/Idh/MocA family oxidoreductase [Anaerolineae bacterium]MCO5196024.1 Gfo/Idh/MocA family oxidoreductase [Anaerolineae bacterium]MCO5206838.1 Gfo/Idh/MocA family oxidoreductase [Anaerolineae bacterium]